jgi:hypothetical protein
MNDNLAGGVTFLAIVYGLVSLVSTLSLHGDGMSFDTGSKPLAERSAKAFAQLKDERQALNDQSRGDGKWTERVKDIAYNVRSGGMGWDFAPFTHYGTNGGMKLTEVANNANIAIIPAQVDEIRPLGSIDAKLIVDGNQGCLIVPFFNSNEDNAANSQKLLHEFDENATGSPYLYGTYEISNKEVKFNPVLPDGQTAADLCGFTLPRETVKTSAPELVS